MTAPKIKLHKGDLPAGLSFPKGVAIDTETLGLKPHRDRLCLVQLSGGDGTAHLVKFDGKSYDAPNLKALLADPKTLKIFHFSTGINNRRYFAYCIIILKLQKLYF